MLERIEDLPRGVDGVRASGKVSRQDYPSVMDAMLDEARRSQKKLRLLYEMGPAFQGFTLMGALADTRVGLSSVPLVEGCAVVSDLPFVRRSSRRFGFFVPYPLRVFSSSEREAAVTWLSSLPEEAAVTHRLLTDPGVVVVSVEKPLRVQDFEEVARTVDAVVDSQGQLTGLVVHTRRFPGWQNVAGLVGHIRFVLAHRAKVRRLAIATDSKIATLAPWLERVARGPRVRGFSYGALETAIRWASERPEATRIVARPWVETRP